MFRQVPTAARTSSIGSTAASVPPSGAGSSVSIVNERAVVRARAPSCHVVTVVNGPRPTARDVEASVQERADRVEPVGADQAAGDTVPRALLDLAWQQLDDGLQLAIQQRAAPAQRVEPRAAGRRWARRAPRCRGGPPAA